MPQQLICYVLVTYGPKPTNPLKAHPAAKSQLRLFDSLVEQRPQSHTVIVSDYARRIEGLYSLPRLQHALSIVEEKGGPTIHFDNLARLFRKTHPGHRQGLLDELQHFGLHIHSFAHHKRLASFSNNELSKLLLRPEKDKKLAKQDRNRDMTPAQVASENSRRSSALKMARSLATVRDELVRKNGETTWRAIAEAANSRGIRTNTGRKWSPQNVSRVLNHFVTG